MACFSPTGVLSLNGKSVPKSSKHLSEVKH
jgi:hypothetical protein